MQNRYAGDVGDFGKFALLRNVFVTDGNKIGVIWYKFPDESHNSDGLHVGYLENPAYKACDEVLIKKLAEVVDADRSVSKLESVRLLPENTVYFSRELNFHLKHPGQTRHARSLRKNKRIGWIGDAAKAVSACNIVFLDPDNGLEIPSVPNQYQTKSGKYAYYSEVELLFRNKDACVIYHHLNRNLTHSEQIKLRAGELKDRIASDGAVFALRFQPFSPRAFFVCATKNSAPEIRRGLRRFLSRSCALGWDNYYEV